MSRKPGRERLAPTGSSHLPPTTRRYMSRSMVARVPRAAAKGCHFLPPASRSGEKGDVDCPGYPFAQSQHIPALLQVLLSVSLLPVGCRACKSLYYRLLLHLSICTSKSERSLGHDDSSAFLRTCSGWHVGNTRLDVAWRWVSPGPRGMKSMSRITSCERHRPGQVHLVDP